MRTAKRILHAVICSARGTAELVGFLVFFLYLVGRTATGEWALAEMIDISVGKNGVVLTVILMVTLFTLGLFYKCVMDNDLNK